MTKKIIPIRSTLDEERVKKEIEEKGIEKILFPESGKLVEDEEGTLHAQIIDLELDPFNCTFHGDNAVTINTKELSYIVLDHAMLDNLKDLIDETDLIYDARPKDDEHV